MSSFNCKSWDSTDFFRTSKPGHLSSGKTDIREWVELGNEREGLRILEEFRKLYESRIDEIEKNVSVSEVERVSVSLVSLKILLIVS